MKIVMVDEKIVNSDEVDKAYFDRGVYFGDGVYEVLRSYNGKIFAFEDHIARFERSMNEIFIKGIDISEIRRRVLTAFEAAKIANAKIYFHVTRGSGPREHSWNDDMKPNFFLTISELSDSPTLKEKGVAVSVYPDMRWKRCDIKSLNLLANVLAHQDASSKGCFDAILVNDDGIITEGSSSAFFSIFGDKLVTTPLAKNILPSITRKYVFKAAAGIGLETEEGLVTPQQARKASELFLGVTTKDIIGVVKFDGTDIGDGKVGKWTKRLIEEFRTFTK